MAIVLSCSALSSSMRMRAVSSPAAASPSGVGATRDGDTVFHEAESHRGEAVADDEQTFVDCG